MDTNLCDDSDYLVYYIMEMNLDPFFQNRYHIYVEIYLYEVIQCRNPQPNPRFNNPERETFENIVWRGANAVIQISLCLTICFTHSVIKIIISDTFIVSSAIWL